MHFFFADDSRQKNPSRAGMSSLVSAGGILVDADKTLSLTNALNDCCDQAGFPEGEEFKWSPGTELWMRRNLLSEARVAFFDSVFAAAAEHEVLAIIAIEDKNFNTAIAGSPDHEFDILCLLLERVEQCFTSKGGVFVVDLPGSPRDEFAAKCRKLIDEGTDYVHFKRFVLPVTALPSKHVRLLQLADVVTSCTTAFVSGENTWSPRTFEKILPLIREEWSRRGGCGLKLHPHYKFANLYHWLLGDKHIQKGMSGAPLPLPTWPYATDADTP
jgi:hypothetical protein